MPHTIHTTHLPADATQRENIKTLLVSPGFQTFKEMVAAHCIQAQADSMNASLYETDAAAQEQGHTAKKAKTLNQFLDFLDDFEKKEEMWFTIKLEHRR